MTGLNTRQSFPKHFKPILKLRIGISILSKMSIPISISPKCYSNTLVEGHGQKLTRQTSMEKQTLLIQWVRRAWGRGKEWHANHAWNNEYVNFAKDRWALNSNIKHWLPWLWLSCWTSPHTASSLNVDFLQELQAVTQCAINEGNDVFNFSFYGHKQSSSKSSRRLARFMPWWFRIRGSGDAFSAPHFFL